MARWMMVAVTLALVGCSSIRPAQNAGAVHRIGQSPDIGEVAAATVGDPVLVSFDYLAARRALVQTAYTRAIGLNRMQVAAGTALFPAIVGGDRAAWCSSAPVFFALGEARVMCFFDPASETLRPRQIGRFQEAQVAGTIRGTEVAVDVPYRIEDAMAGTGTRTELLYQGLDRGVVRLSFREFVNDLARPAFTQELTYTLEPGGRPTLISFRRARLEVLSASNNEIRYRVVAAFE